MNSTSQPLRVGIVGINPKKGWGRYSHVPAIQSLPDLKLAAVATRNETSARAAAEAFAAEHWFADPLAMVRSDAVDLVCVSVNVPAHRAIVLAALATGKHVYSEWPTGAQLGGEPGDGCHGGACRRPHSHWSARTRESGFAARA
jgi:predicted dehydrogenase